MSIIQRNNVYSKMKFISFHSPDISQSESLEVDDTEIPGNKIFKIDPLQSGICSTTFV